MNSLCNFLNKKGKTILSLCLAVLMVLSLSACGNDTANSSSNSGGLTEGDNSSSTTTSLVFIDDDRREEDDNSSDKYQQEHPDQPDISSTGGGVNSTVSSGGGDTTTIKPVGKGKFTPVKLSDLPGFTGSKYYVVSGNIPNFSVAELTTKSYEKYSPLDSLGRVGPAIASLSKDTMPKAGESRGDISSVKPTGWVQGKYSIVPSSWLYNRSHLIAWQLSAENANAQNLMTGTQFFNQTCMKPWENMVADYIKETGNHVAYRVTPIFEGNNKLAHGVQMEAYSIEDGGKGIQFNIFIYNVQDGITINYATGQNSLAS